MDLNQLYFDHQISLMRATATGNARLRLVHGNHAAIIARSIASIHRASGAGALCDWEAARFGLESATAPPMVAAS